MAEKKPGAEPSTKTPPPEQTAAAGTPADDPTPEQRAAWMALPKEQKTALREREAQRLFTLAIEQHQKGDLNAAVAGYGKALRLTPKSPDIYNNMGVALRVLGKFGAAVACYRRSLILRPNSSSVYSNMGNALRELGRLSLSITSHQQAIKLAPDSGEAYYNLGLALRDLGQINQALSAFERTLGFNPDHAECRWDRALTLLLKGDFTRGFEEYEWRWKLERSPPRDLGEPLWDGQELKGKTVLIHQEQGFGDMIQFARYIPMIKEKGGAVVVEVQPELARLFSTIPGVDKVINRGSPLPKFDFYAPMMSLARIFATTPETIPAALPYLKPPEMHAVQLPASLDHQRQIGIVWAGKPTHKNDRNRSCDFTHFIELLGIPGATIYSLQKGPREADISEHGCEALVSSLGAQLSDFADTASVIAQLDMVITVDTSVAHLAGALGIPAWVVIPFAPDWRWMTETAETPWYPGMRLFRQQKPGDWQSVFTELRYALRVELGITPDASQ